MSKPGSAVIEDLEDRDPNSLNQHLQRRSVLDKIKLPQVRAMVKTITIFVVEPQATRGIAARPSHAILNFGFEVLWDDVIGEPDGVRSPECAWRLSNNCFKYSKNCCYIFLSVLIAPLVALCLGLTFACLAFEHIWCVGPCLRVLKISCAACRTSTRACAQAVVVPCSEALGTFWGGMRLQHHTLTEAPDRREDVLLV